VLFPINTWPDESDVAPVPPRFTANVPVVLPIAICDEPETVPAGNIALTSPVVIVPSVVTFVEPR